ncbi:TPA: TIGR03759 family integrating conjugative element protein [Legionella pneumophila]|nr:TIGR03759 family integrating conjugative element protein [Legionella pneumophila]HBD7283627.1 TIGR03759 family integrating conjugative element protein [Legionella pneumophila]HBD9439219.1 TIGR03759 family integrating conjugative element protein [Legionella pneumophila]HEN8241146.1 TIGR03759 family integrating conjugative element protein [Legionella pneumophila]
MLKRFVSLLCLLPGLSMAAIHLPGINDAAIENASNDLDFARTGIHQNIDDITEDQDIEAVRLSEKDKHTALVWTLSDNEMKRYKLLMENKSSIYYEGLKLTPLDILGINARNEQERDHFAEISAKFEAQKVAKNLAWNNAHFRAYQKIVQGLPVIQNFDASKDGPHAYRPIQLKSGQQLHFYLKKDDAVTTLVAPLVKAIEESQNTLLVLDCLDCSSSDMQLWANNHNIPKNLVDSGRIRLDLGRIAFDGLNMPAKEKKTPLLISVMGTHANLVDLGSL